MGLRHLRQHIRAAEAAAGEPSTSLRQLYKDMLQLKRLGEEGVAPWLLALGVDKISTHILSVLTNIKSNQDRIQALKQVFMPSGSRWRAWSTSPTHQHRVRDRLNDLYSFHADMTDKGEVSAWCRRCHARGQVILHRVRAGQTFMLSTRQHVAQVWRDGTLIHHFSGHHHPPPSLGGTR